MSELKQGMVAISIPDHISIPEKAGKLSAEEVRQVVKARRGVGLAADQTADAMTRFGKDFQVPEVDPKALAAMGKAAEDIDVVINDVETVLTTLKQANVLIDGEAHEMLRRVLAYVRAQEKFRPELTAKVPALISYFASSKPAAPQPK